VISGSAERTAAFYKRYRAGTWEKVAVIIFLILAQLSLSGLAPPDGDFGSLASGGWIPLLNILVAIKVTLGSWAILQLFVRYRGLL
jgi:multicomponent Na+:H+ antiporter subunit B